MIPYSPDTPSRRYTGTRLLPVTSVISVVQSFFLFFSGVKIVLKSFFMLTGTQPRSATISLTRPVLSE